MIEKGVDQRKVVERIVGDFEDWKSARRSKEEVWREALNAYLTTIDESNYDEWPWRCKVADTLVQETGDAIASALRNALFPVNERYFEVRGVDELGHHYQDVMQKYLSEKLNTAGFIERVRPFLMQLAVLGNAPAITPWHTNTRIRRQRVQTPEGVRVLDEAEVLYDNFTFETLDAFDVVFNPSKIYLHDTPIIRRLEKSKASLKSEADFYENLAELEDDGAAHSDESEGEKRERATVFGLNYEPDPEAIELLEAHGVFEIDGNDLFSFVKREVDFPVAVVRFERMLRDIQENAARAQ